MRRFLIIAIGVCLSAAAGAQAPFVHGSGDPRLRAAETICPARFYIDDANNQKLYMATTGSPCTWTDPSASASYPGVASDGANGLAVAGTMASSGVMPQPTYGSVNCWGDSLTSGNQDGGGNYCSQLGALAGLTVVNQGVSGNTSAQILTRMQAAPPAAGTLNIIWACTNDTSGPTCLANIASMVSLVQSQGAYYIVLSPLNSDSTNKRGPFGTSYLMYPAVAQQEKTLYPDNFIDIHEMLVGAWNSASPGDAGSWGWDLAAESYRTHYTNALAADITTTATCAISFTGTAFAGMTVVVDSEVIFATSISGNTITACARGYMGTTAATHTSGTSAPFVDMTHLSGSVGYPFVAAQVQQWMLAHPAGTTGIPNLALAGKRALSDQSSLGGYVTAVLQRCAYVYGIASCQPTTFEIDGATAPILSIVNVDTTNRLTTQHFKNASNEWDLGLQGASAVAFQLTDFSNAGAILWSCARTTDVCSFPLAAGVSIAKLSSATNCSSAAAPAVCGSAIAGSVVVAAAATTVTVNTTAVTANSQILLQEDSSLGTKLGVTCNTTPATAPPAVTARTAGTSFAILTTTPTTNPRCFSYSIIN
jgi:hypothetical protein